MKKPGGGGTTNKAPVILAQTFLVDDNSGAGSVVGTVVATDPEGDPLSYILSGEDVDLFVIDQDGIIRFKSTFSGPLDLTGYDLTVSVTDGKHTPVTAPVTVSVGEVIDLGTLAPADGFSITGPDGGGIGSRVSSAGDVNNDGVADFMVTAGNAHDVYVVFGDSNSDGSGNYEDIDLTDTSTWDGFALIGGTSGPGAINLGDAISPAGDVNGDGVDDLIMSANDGLLGSNIVIFGKDSPMGETFPDVYNLPNAQSLEDFSSSGDGVLIRGGFALASAGDVNGDGIGDLIIGEGGADGLGRKGRSAGEAYVVYGATDIADIDLADTSSWDGLRILGSTNLQQVGFSVSSAGDINGDGRDDVIVGAVGADTDGNTRTAEGAAYVIYGRASGAGVTDINLASLAPGDGFRILGVDPDDRLGWSVAGVGDANGDGTDDLIVAADAADGDRGGTNVGEVYLILGTDSATRGDIDLATLAAADGIRFVGIDSSDFAGRSVSAAGDVNGDGISDILIGTSGGDGNGESNAGEAYLIFGRTSWSGGTIDLGSLSAEDGVVIFGDEAGDRAGYSVSAAGDINNDGYDDILVGAWGAENGVGVPDQDDGAAYILFGRDFSADTMVFG